MQEAIPKKLIRWEIKDLKIVRSVPAVRSFAEQTEKGHSIHFT